MIILNRDSFSDYANGLVIVTEAYDLIGFGSYRDCGI